MGKRSVEQSVEILWQPVSSVSQGLFKSSEHYLNKIDYGRGVTTSKKGQLGMCGNY